MANHIIKIHNVINLSEARASINQSGMTGALVASPPENDPSFDKMISEPILDAISKNEALLKDVGSKINDSIQTINRFAEAAFQSETFKQFSDNLNVAIEVIEKNRASFVGLFTNIGLFKETCNGLISIGKDPEEEFRKVYEKAERLLEVPKELEKPIPEVIEIRRNPKLQAEFFVAELLRNKTANYWKLELYSRSLLWETNREKGKTRVTLSKRVVHLINDEFLELQGITPAYQSGKSRKKDQLIENLNRLNVVCQTANKFPMFSRIQETVKGALVEFHAVYVMKYFETGSTTLHFAFKFLYKLNNIVWIKTAQRLIDHASMPNNRRNKTHTCLSYESLVNAVFIDTGFSSPRARSLAKNKIAREIREALCYFDSMGFIEFDGWKIGRSKELFDDESVTFNHAKAIDDKYRIVFRLPDLERYLKNRDKELGI